MIQPAIVKIGEHSYRIGRLSTFDQMDLATSCRAVFFNMALLEKTAEKDGQAIDHEGYAQAMCGFMGMLEKGARDAATKLCLSVVARGRGKNNTNWDPAYQGDQFMLGDLDAPELFRLIYEICRHNGLFRFFAVSLASNEKAEAQTAASSSSAAA